MAKKLTLALAGNPNVGKTVLFNALTGSRQHVGNWPGKTVEKKEGRLTHKGHSITVVDLPGTYSLTAYSTEEIITRNYIVDEKPDVVIHIVDSTNLERNLYLTTQLIELNAPVILCLNMTDLADERGLAIDAKRISQLLGIPAVKIIATQKVGVDKLLDEALRLAGKKDASPKRGITYGTELEKHIAELQEFISANITIPENYNPRWLALKLLEDDKEVDDKIRTLEGGKAVLKEADKNTYHLRGIFGEDVETAVAEARYGFIAGLVRESVRKPKASRIDKSDIIDAVATHKFFGIPIFLFLMWLMFHLTFTAGAPLSDLIDAFFGLLGEGIANLLTGSSFPAWASSLLVDGIIAGVGSVMVFVPFIFLLFLVISLLEDSGYLARAAFIMDNVMHRIGLHGKSFIPLVLGFGCGVPAVMATRTLENRKDRILTILITPFMSCSARLPVYVLFVGAFFPSHQGGVVFSLYLFGIVMAIVMGLVFKRILFKGLSTPFVMELPPYRLPTLRGAVIHMWERGVIFIRNAGTIIFLMVVLIWFLSNMPFGVEYASQESIIGMIGTAIAPVFRPLGFGTWQASVSLIFGFAAKEVVVGTFGTVYGVGEAGLVGALQNSFTPLSAYAFLVFVLLYVPCMAMIAVIKRETNSWRWPLFTVFYTTAIAWVVAFIVYQGGLLVGFA